MTPAPIMAAKSRAVGRYIFLYISAGFCANPGSGLEKSLLELGNVAVFEDGTRVPYFQVGRPFDGPAPTMLFTVTPDDIVPCMSSQLKKRLGMKNTAAFNINTAYSG